MSFLSSLAEQDWTGAAKARRRNQISLSDCFRPSVPEAPSTSLFCLTVARVCANDSDVCLPASLLVGRRLLIKILTQSLPAVGVNCRLWGQILWDQPPAAGFTGTWDCSAAAEARLHVSLISSSKIERRRIHFECFSVSLAICESFRKGFIGCPGMCGELTKFRPRRFWRQFANVGKDARFRRSSRCDVTEGP